MSESTVSARIAATRKAVGDDGKRQAVIRTVSRRGPEMAVAVERAGALTTEPAALVVQRVHYAVKDQGRSLA